MTNYFSSGRTHDVGRTASQAPKPTPSQEPERRITVANVSSYLTAEASLHLKGPVTDEVFAERRAHCMSCPSRKTGGSIQDDIGFCSSCGCGVSQRSRLTVKLTMPDSSCPLQKWGKAPGRHRSVVDRAKAWVVQKLLGVG